MKKIDPVGIMSALNVLQVNQRNFGADSQQKVSEALQVLQHNFPTLEKEVIALHDALLFSIAYPSSEQNLQQGNLLMNVLVQTVQKAVQSDPNAFYNSGITGSLVCAQFGLLLNNYLLGEDLQTLELSDVDGHNTDLVGKLTFTLDTVEQELMPDDAAYFTKWQKRYLPAINNKDDLLRYYIEASMQMNGSIAYRENLFAGFQLYTQFSLDEKLLGLSKGRLSLGSHFIHTQGIQKKCTLESVFLEGKPEKIKLNTHKKERLVRLARGSMASLLRETDTFTYAQTEETELFEMGKGVCIALYYMIPEQKFTLQSYVGYLLFKNGVPMAYGGCWLFGFQAAFGVNVLPPFRGGESANVVAQLIRLYHFRFHIHQFTVDPYQIGKGNSDGIKSGAFWFYYKLGFRPMQKNLADLAQQEMQKMETEKGYRTPAKTLVKLANAEIFWQIDENRKPYFPLLPVSDAISKHIAKNHHGNRQLAFSEAKRKFQKALKIKIGTHSFLNQMLLTLDSLGAMEKLSPKELEKVGKAYDQKSYGEADTHLKLQKVKGFWRLFKSE